MTIKTLDPVQEYTIISDIINVVGRDIILTYVATRGACPVCNNTNPFCDTCHGNPTTDTTVNQTVLANVKWRSSNKKIYQPQGQDADGDCIVHFLVDSVEAYETTDTLLKKIISVTVDNRVCAVKYWYFRGSPINRVHLVLTQTEDVGGQRIG